MEKSQNIGTKSAFTPFIYYYFSLSISISLSSPSLQPKATHGTTTTTRASPLMAPPPPPHQHHNRPEITNPQQIGNHDPISTHILNWKPCYPQSHHHCDPLSSLKPMTTIYRYSDQTTNQRVQMRKREEQERENHHREEERQAREREEREWREKQYNPIKIAIPIAIVSCYWYQFIAATC